MASCEGTCEVWSILYPQASRSCAVMCMHQNCEAIWRNEAQLNKGGYVTGEMPMTLLKP